MDLFTILKNAGESDLATRQDAENRINTASQTDFGGFLHALSVELANNDRPFNTRQLAGILLKNAISSNDQVKNEALAKQWVSVSENIKNEIKNMLLVTLSAQRFEARHTSAQVISKIALIELQINQWPTLLPTLINNVSGQQTEFIKQSSLQTIGYICQEIDPDLIKDASDQILTVIIHGMKDNTSELVKTAATEALYNALEFVQHNFEKKAERDYIMQTIFENCSAQNEVIKRLAFENLVKVVALYYNYILEYMGDIYSLTVNAIQNEKNEKVVLQAIEFWTSLAEEEINLQDIDDSKDLMAKALPAFLPVILPTLTKQDEFGGDTWDICKAGATCLTFIAIDVMDLILPHVVPFIKEKIMSADWRDREAACVALGSILEGTSEYDTFLFDVTPIIVNQLKDSNEMVKDTASWTLGRICGHQIESVADRLEMILNGLLEATADPNPKVAAHACWGIHNICQAFEEGPVGKVTSLAQVFQPLAQKLFVAAHRSDADQDSLRVNAFEALNSLISFSQADVANVLVVLDFILKDFESSFQIEGSNDNKKQIQSLLCSSLQTIASTLQGHVKSRAEKMLYVLYNVFTTDSHIIYEEALMAIGAVIQALDSDIKPYLQGFIPILTHNLRNVEYGEVSNISIGIVSDMTRSLGKDFTIYAPQFIPLIIQDLTDPKISMNAKPNALTCIGDIAMAIGVDFIPYLPKIMPILEQATIVQLDDIEYLNTLRNAIFEAYTGIIHGLKSGGSGNTFENYVQQVLQFISIIFQDIGRTNPQVIGAAIGILGDIAQTLGENVKLQLRHEVVKKLIDTGVQQELNVDVSKWAYDVIFK